MCWYTWHTFSLFVWKQQKGCRFSAKRTRISNEEKKEACHLFREVCGKSLHQSGQQLEERWWFREQKSISAFSLSWSEDEFLWDSPIDFSHLLWLSWIFLWQNSVWNAFQISRLVFPVSGVSFFNNRILCERWSSDAGYFYTFQEERERERSIVKNLSVICFGSEIMLMMIIITLYLSLCVVLSYLSCWVSIQTLIAWRNLVSGKEYS